VRLYLKLLVMIAAFAAVAARLGIELSDEDRDRIRLECQHEAFACHGSPPPLGAADR
jgi:hypothetical protein